MAVQKDESFAVEGGNEMDLTISKYCILFTNYIGSRGSVFIVYVLPSPHNLIYFSKFLFRFLSYKF